MRLGDTIVACGTGPGSGGLAIVRLSGPDAMLAIRVKLGCSVGPERGWHAGAIELESDLPACGDAGRGGIVVPVGVLVYPAGRSFTNECVVELQMPGHPALVQRTIDALLGHEGVRLAEPGEFTARAYLNGRLTAEQAEGVRAVIESRSQGELDAARRVLAGQTGAIYRRLADELAGALALVEAGIDFTDQEDVVAIAPSALDARLSALLDEIDRLLGHDGGAAERLTTNPRVVLAGPPNAGKSTMFNALLGSARSVVADLAGTTRDAIEEPTEIVPGVAITLVDLAGLDAALQSGGASEAAAQSAAVELIERADVVVWCDPTGRFERGDGRIVGLARRSPIRVRTKGDLPHAGATEAAGLSVCGLDGWGVAALRRAIGDAATAEASGDAEHLALIPRHRRSLSAAGAALRAARLGASAAAHGGHLADPALVAGAMREALDELGAIAGAISPDDVIGRIFATFCVGK